MENRKATAAPSHLIREPIKVACDNFEYRREHAPEDRVEFVGEAVWSANELAVQAYDIHPFIDGNTRATWSLRNYALMRYGLDRVIKGGSDPRYLSAWWKATPGSHDALDEAVLEILIWQDSQRQVHNRIL